MKTFLILFLLFISSISFSQIKVEVKDISDDYFAEITIADTNDYDKPGVITVYDKKSNAKLIGVEFKGIILELHYGKILCNNSEMPYIKQSFIIYQDFNFDGVKDFALLDGFNGCYSLPSYQVFLANNGQFVLNKDFTDLAQNNCGMFAVNYEKKTIKTFKKDGDCWIEYSEYIIENNVPKLISVITEDLATDDAYVYITTQKLVGEKWKKTRRRIKIEDYYKEKEGEK